MSDNQETTQPQYLTAYDVRTKEKGVPILEAVISKTKKGAYMVKGVAANGNKLTTLCNKEKAEAAVAAGVAKWADDELK